MRFEGIDVIEVNDQGKIQTLHAYGSPAPSSERFRETRGSRETSVGGNNRVTSCLLAAGRSTGVHHAWDGGRGFEVCQAVLMALTTLARVSKAWRGGTLSEQCRVCVAVLVNREKGRQCNDALRRRQFGCVGTARCTRRR